MWVEDVLYGALTSGVNVRGLPSYGYFDKKG